ncbi:MAG: TrmH family RNA methyltransferase [bacterium]|nr:TrmH family RNA methyltransferase [bacterium]
MSLKRFILVADNIRSLENVGSLFRIADAFGAEAIYIVGISGYPDMGEKDARRQWLRDKNTKAIKKSGLSGLTSIPFTYFATIEECLQEIRRKNYSIVSIEQQEKSVKLETVKSVPFPCCLIFGNEVTGVSQKFLDDSDLILEITQYGQGKSLNVSVCAGITCYILTHLV